jgi:hypothetical protein
MQQEGPLLESLLHRLSECPPEFLETPFPGKGGINVLAVVCDHLRKIAPDQPPDLDADLKQISTYSENHRSLLAVVSWLLHDEWFLNRAFLAPKMKALLLSAELAGLAPLVPAGKLIEDPDRREELVRVCLRGLGLRPNGESELQAADRLNTLDSAERVRVLHATAAAERRARQIREAMARQAAQDAASRYGE